MLGPECPLPPSPSPVPRDGCSAAETEDSISVAQGRETALEPLRLPPRPHPTLDPADGPATELAREDAKHSPYTATSTVTTSREAALQPRLFLRNLTESVAIMVDGVRNFALDGNVSTTWKVLNFGGATAAVLGSSCYGVPWALGALSFVVARLGASLTENRHTRAHGAVLGSILSVHFISLELDAMAVAAEVFAGRMILQSMIPESKRMLNAVVASVGIALSAYSFCSSPEFTPEINLQNAPLAVTIVGGIASSLSDKWSWASRLANLTCSSVMLPYHCMVSGSWFLAALSGVFAYGNVKNIFKIDLPRFRDRGETLP